MRRPLLRLADLRDLTDAELRRHIFVRYMACPDCEGWGVHELGGMRRYGPDEDTCIACSGQGHSFDTDPTDAELAQRIGILLVAYESVGDDGCDSSAYFLIERDGDLYEVHGSHDSTCGFEGQWEPRPVMPSYLVSEHWRMGLGGYDEHRESGRRCNECNGAGYLVDGRTLDISRICPACDGSGRVHDVATDSDLSTREVVMLWLHHRFGGELAEQPFVLPEWAIPTWARHVDKQGNVVDLRVVDDRYLLNIVRWACRKVRKHWRKRYVYEVDDGETMQQVVMVGPHDDHALAWEINKLPGEVYAHATDSGEVIIVDDGPATHYARLHVRRSEPTARGSFFNAMREVEARGLLPTWDELRVAADLAEFRGAVVHRPIVADEVACVPIEGGPWDLVDLWVGYGVRGNEA